MKAIKPLRIGLLLRVFEHDRRYQLVVTTCVFLRLGERPTALTEPEMWRFLAEALGRDAAFDEAMPKSRAEFLVTGSAYAPGGASVAVDVRARVGNIEKRLRAVGDRRWLPSGAMSSPQPFTSMPLTWSRAFGGANEPRNPLGRGSAPVETEHGPVHFLPNVEDPRRAVTSIGDRPEPAGFGPLDFSWPQRFARIGTYDAKWLKEQFPGLAKDIDWTFFNVAPEDQRQEQWWRGDERYVLEGMHPEKRAVQGELPGLVTRAFVTVRDRGWLELQTRLDTVHFFPDAERAVLVFRGTTPIASDDGHDVEDVMVACERAGEPRTVEHYAQVRANRLDETHAPRFVLREQDLLPPELADAPPDPMVAKLSALATPENLVARNMQRRAELEHAKLEAKVREAGLDPATFVRPLPAPPGPMPDPNDVGALMDYAEREGERARAEANKQREAAMAQARAACASLGVDLDALQAWVQAKNAGPPKFRAKDEVAKMRADLDTATAAGVDVSAMRALVDDPGMEEKLTRAEAALVSSYRAHAHRMPGASKQSDEVTQWWRARIAEAVLAGELIDGADLTGVDLSGMDLRRASFRDAFLEGCSFEGSDASGADFSGAVLVRANLKGVNLSGAKLVGANLGASDLTGADLTGADLTRACLSSAALKRTVLRGVVMPKVDLLDTTFSETDFTEARMPETVFLRVDLSGCRFVGADLSKSVFLESRLDGADLSGANVDNGALVKTSAKGVVLRGASLAGLRVVHGSDLSGADLQEARGPKANFRGTAMQGAKLSKASFDGADFSECDLRGAQLYRTTLRGAMLVRTDLTDAMMVSVNAMMAILQKAVIQGADLTGANLFRTDLALVVGRPKSLADALLEQARVVQREGA